MEEIIGEALPAYVSVPYSLSWQLVRGFLGPLPTGRRCATTAPGQPHRSRPVDRHLTRGRSNALFEPAEYCAQQALVLVLRGDIFELSTGILDKRIAVENPLITVLLPVPLAGRLCPERPYVQSRGICRDMRHIDKEVIVQSSSTSKGFRIRYEKRAIFLFDAGMFRLQQLKQGLRKGAVVSKQQRAGVDPSRQKLEREV